MTTQNQILKKFALLSLRYNSNVVVHEIFATDVKEAARIFNEMVELADGQGGKLPLGLDEDGYRKGDPQLGDSVTYCIARYASF